MAQILSVPVRLSPGVDSFKMLFSQFGSGWQTLDDILAVVGLLFIGKIVVVTTWDILVGLRAMVWARLWKCNFEKRYGGKWAVITGCTDGIGKAYAHEFARDGLNILLISRTLEKLKNVATEIESAHEVETEIVQADFTTGESIYPEIMEAVKGKSVAILVNNVGVMIVPPKYTHEYNDFEIRSIINVNMQSVMKMTQIILPQMMSRDKGAIVNIASIAASGPIPLNGPYAGSKAFVEYVSESLSWECVGTGVTVQTVIPSFVSTNLVNYSKWLNSANFIVPNATSFARSAVPTIGYTSYTTGYWTHGIQKYFVNLMPQWMFVGMMAFSHKILRNSAMNDHTN